MYIIYCSYQPYIEYDNYETEILEIDKCETEEKAKEIVERLDREVGETIYEVNNSYPATFFYKKYEEPIGVDAFIKKWDKKKDYFTNKMFEYEELLSQLNSDIITLRKAREFLAPYDLRNKSHEEFRKLIPEIYKEAVKTDLPISFYDLKFDYTRNGINVINGNEVSDYMLNIKTSNGSCGYFSLLNTYDFWDNYDIANDIQLKIDEREEVLEEIEDLKEEMEAMFK